MEESRNDGNSSGAPVDEGGGVVYSVINTQDSLVEGQGGERGRKKKGNLPLVIVLVVLGVVIVGLVVGIVIIGLLNKQVSNRGSDTGVYEQGIVKLDYNVPGYSEGEAPSSAVVVQFENDIYNKLQDDPDYTYDDAISDYRSAVAGSSGNVKIECAMSFANFIYNESGDLEQAVDILSSVEDLLNDDTIKINYYNLLADLYRQSGDEEKARYYEQLVLAVEPEVTVTYDDIYGEED